MSPDESTGPRSDATLHGVGTDITLHGLGAELAAALQRQHQSWQSGQRVSIEELLTGFQATAEEVLELVYNEVILRESLGEAPRLEEYEARFPSVAEPLRIQWSIDRALLGSIADDQDSAGDGVGRYVIEHELGRGSMGIVFQAWDSKLNRVVALKRLRGGFDAGPDDWRRLQGEAEAIARFTHPNIVQVYDVGEQDGQPFFAMELCTGGSLAARLDGKPIPPHDAARLVRQLAEGVAEAHRRQLVHRDLKPSNVMLAGDDLNAPKITDFGLAKWLDVDQRLTTTGVLVGTPTFMAPEQAQGEKAQIGPAVDIYALGAILYQCLTGSPPLQGISIADTLNQVCHREPVPVRQLQPAVPLDLETIALKCLQKDPQRRYLTATELAEDLDAFLSGRVIKARPVSSLERCWRWCRRNPRTAWLLGSVAALLVALAAGSFVAAMWLKRERDAARRAEAKASASDMERRERLYDAYLLEAQTTRLANVAGYRERGLAAIRNILGALSDAQLTDEQRDQLRDEALALMPLVDVRPSMKIADWCSSHLIGDADLSPDFELAAVRHPQGTTMIGPVDAHQADVEQPPLPGSEHGPGARRFSEDGNWLVAVNWPTFAENSDNLILQVWDRRARRWLPERQLAGGINHMVLHPRLTEVAILGADGAVRIHDYRRAGPVRTSPARFPDSTLVYSPDGKWLAIGGIHRPAEIIDAQTWEVLATIPEARRTTAIAWNPAIDELYLGDTEGKTYIWRTSSGAGALDPHAQLAGITAMCVSADGEYLAASSRDNTTFLRRRSGGTTGFSISGRAIRFNSHERQIATVDNGRVTVFDLTGGTALRTRETTADGLQFSPDGLWLATGGAEGARIFSCPSLQELCRLDLDPVGPVAFRPDGRALATFGIFSHLWQWPLEPLDIHRWRVGPARHVALGSDTTLVQNLSVEPHHRGRTVAWSQDGTLFFVVDYRRDRILWRRGSVEPLREFATLRAVSTITISPDNRFVAAGAAVYPQVRVWSLEDGKPVFDLPLFSKVAFSSDGSHLAAGSTSGVQLYEVGSWRLAYSVGRETTDADPSPVAFQPRGSLLAFSRGPGRICLYDVARQREAGNLRDPATRRVSSVAFSPDGKRLAFAGAASDIGLWDLAALRQGLGALGIAAEGLPSADPQAPPAPDEADRLEVVWSKELPKRDQWSKKWLLLAKWELLKGSPAGALISVSSALQTLRADASPHERAELLTASGEIHLLNQSPESARDDWERALELEPNRFSAIKDLARLYLLGPSSVRSPQRALALLVAHVQANADDQEARRLLGIAWARMERWEQAKLALSECTSESEYLEQLFLALALKRTGENEQAAQRVQSAREQAQKHRDRLSKLQRQMLDEAIAEISAAISSGSDQ